MSETKKETKETEKTKKADTKEKTAGTEKVIEYHEDPNPTMTPYTAIALLAAVISVAAAAFAMLLLSDPVVHAANALFGALYEEGYTREFALEMIDINMKEDGSANTYKLMVILAMAVVVLTALTSIYLAIRSINPEKKPQILVGIVAFALSLGAVLLYIFAHANIMGVLKELMETINPGVDISGYGVFDWIYYGNLIAAGTNALFMGINIFGLLSGNNRFTQNGRAF